MDAKHNLTVDAAREYLEDGGLGEVIGFTSIALQRCQPKVQSNTGMAMALCLLAADGMAAVARVNALREALTEMITHFAPPVDESEWPDAHERHALRIARAALKESSDA